MGTKHNSCKVMSAPVVSNSNGFLQKALQESAALGPVSSCESLTIVQSSPTRLSYTPLATPTPTAGAYSGHDQWPGLSLAAQLAAYVESTSLQQMVVAQPARRCNWADIPVGKPSISYDRAEPGEDDVDSDDGQDVVDVSNAPKPPPDALHPSLGSGTHEEGTCKRCCFFPRGRCTNGYECQFCHYDHE